MSRSSSCWQWHGFCPFAGYDDFALCSLRRRQARGVFTGAFAATVPAACFASWDVGWTFWGPVHRHRAGGRVHRDMTPIIRCIRAVVSTKTLLLHLVRTTTTTTTTTTTRATQHKVFCPQQWSDLFVCVSSGSPCQWLAATSAVRARPAAGGSADCDSGFATRSCRWGHRCLLHRGRGRLL